MDSTALRSRRHKMHRRGDHSICQPGRCKLAGQDLTDTPAATLGSRGATLWRDLRGESLAPEVQVLLLEACRIADRLDQLDLLLAGDVETWVSLTEERADSERVYVVLDRALSEARQQAVALRQLIAEIRAAGAGGKSRPTPGPQQSGREVAGVTDLTTWAPARSAKPAG